MEFDMIRGCYTQSTDETINVFCAELAEKALMMDRSIMGRYDDVYLFAERGCKASDLIEEYHKAMEQIKDHNLKKNGEGYTDLTAYNAIKNTERPHYHRVSPEDKERHSKLIGCIHRICELSDFTLEERVVVKDKRTGKVWR